jgi:hypothetical protein
MNLRRIFLAAFGALALSACAPVDTAASGPAMITLERTVCFGFCPAYTVTISSTGEVVYRGERFVNVTGEQRAQIPASDVQALLARFDAINFEGLRDEYRAQVTDLPTTTITLERNGRTKRVLDYGGVGAGMPESVRDLQAEIDRVANTGRWVLRNGQPVRTPRPDH